MATQQGKKLGFRSKSLFEEERMVYSHRSPSIYRWTRSL